ncbi:MAG: sulfatase-like hydrolase/transferase [Proteobacteria bacterium]|nr:sulfatase-like hydrolase/transferase [Pseudomonadota bacterium]MDA1290908.1 sulfatase-like hydrolase/transferase [Pseudomonadota bacterium]
MSSMQRIQLLLFFMPVALAHYYSLDRSLLSVFSALVSVSLIVLTSTALISQFEHGTVRTSIGLVVIYLLSFYYASQFISYYLQGSYFNQQYLFHFNLTTLRESLAAYYSLMFLIAGWTACVLFGFYYLRAQLPRSSHSLPALAGLFVLALMLDPGLRPSVFAMANSALSPRIDSLEAIAWEELSLEQDALTNTQFTSTPGKNLLFIFLEGFEAIYTDKDLFPGLTPNLQALNEEGWQLDNMQQVEGSGWTIAGMVSSLCGTPLLYESSFGGNEVLFSRMLDKATCLPDVLSSAGYQQIFMGGAALGFANKGNFLLEHGFDTTLGRHALVNELADPNYVSGWGLYDDSLFSQALEQFTSLAASEQPFNLTLLTVDTHHPIDEPSASCSEYDQIDNSILHAVHCTDYLLGEFLDQVKAHPAYEDTVVVLVSDHLAMRNNAFPLFPENYQRRLYFNVLNSSAAVEQEIFATPLDISPTVLQLLGVQHDVTFLAGLDLLNTPLKDAVRDTYDPNRLDAIRYINSNHLSTVEENIAFSLSRQTLGEMDFSESISNVRYNGGQLQFDAATGDPYFMLPALGDVQFSDAMLYLTIETDEQLNVAIYFEAEPGQGYSEENTLQRYIPVGLNRVVFELKGVATGSRIRIDPGQLPGRYSIRELEIRAQ